jgi:uncharacterized repeat protein (TIGR01451 family)
MKRTWTLWIAGVGLATVLVSQAVRGQQDLPQPQAAPLPNAFPRGGVPAQAERPVEGPNLNNVPAPVQVVIPGSPGEVVNPAPAPAPVSPQPVAQAAPLAPPPAAQAAPIAPPAENQVLFSTSPPPSVPAPHKMPLPEKTTTPEAAPVAEMHGGRQEPALTIEWLGPAVVRLNHPLSCQIVVRNTSAIAVQNVTVRHRPGEGIQFRSSEPPANNEGNELSWALGTLSAGQVKKVELQMVAQSRGAVNCQATVTFSAAMGHQFIVREPLLAVKMRAPEKVIGGENVTLNFTVNNPGDGVTDGVKLKAILPEGLEHSRGRVLEVEVGSLAPKESRNLQLVCLAKGNGTLKCQVLASAEGSLNARDAVDLEVLHPKLDLAQAGPKLRYIDRHAVYQLKVSNPGSAPATGVALHEVVPAGFKFHSASAGGRYDEATRTVAWALGDLPPSQSREVALDLVPTAAGEHRLVALVTSARGLKCGTEVRTQVEGLPSLLIELADVEDPVEVGAETAYELRVTNSGTKMETNLEVACTLPEQVELRGVKCGADLRYRLEGRDLVFEPLPRLAPKADVIYRLQVRGKLPGDARLRVRVKADDLREPVLREESTRFYSDDAPLQPVATQR